MESDLTEGVKLPTTATPTEATPLSTNTYGSPLKSSPRKLRKRSTTKSVSLPVREIYDFDMFNIPSGVDLHGLIKDFVVPRLPQGFCVRLEGLKEVNIWRQMTKRRQPKVLCLARHRNIAMGRCADVLLEGYKPNCREKHINDEFLDLSEPRELFPLASFEKELKFKNKLSSVSEEAKPTTLVLGKTTEIKKMDSVPESKEVSRNASKTSSKNSKSNSLSSQGSSKKDSQSNSQNSSRRTSEEKKSTEELEPQTYMFSQLIKVCLNSWHLIRRV